MNERPDNLQLEHNLASIELADLLIGKDVPSFSDIEQNYPERSLPKGAKVVRVAPSPTGFAHFGLIYTSMVNEQVARGSNGVFILRIEDTDKKREVVGGVDLIINALDDFGIGFDEGVCKGGEMGEYGPYKQSERREIYLSAVKELLVNGAAYPCFCGENELNELRSGQEQRKEKTGYYGKYAKCSNLTQREIVEKVKSGEKYVIRFRSGSVPAEGTYIDSIRGKTGMPINDIDYVLFKTGENGLSLPVYHLAAMVDDHLARVTDVIRGDEWIDSLSLHLQLIKAFGWESPKFAHLSTIKKMGEVETEDGIKIGKRKLSKRKDPEAAASYYLERGIPAVAVRAYVLRLADPFFEDWRTKNQSVDLIDYKLELSRMAASAGALFDNDKFMDICRQEISNMSADEIYEESLKWSAKYNQALYSQLSKNPDYSRRILGIEREGEKKRKDIAMWSDLSELMSFFYDEVYDDLDIDLKTDKVNMEAAVEILKSYLEVYNESDSKEEWLEKVKQMCVDLGYAAEMKSYKASPDSYRGNLADVAMVLRLALSGRTKTPDLFEMMKAMGGDRVLKRLSGF